MTDKEKIRAEIEKLKESGCASPIVICDTLLAFIDSMQEETVSDDLKKFAEEWDESLYRSDAVIAGAKWHKQQMIKSAVDAFIYKGNIRLKEWPLPEKCGKHLDSVKVIIIKEDKV
jgi:hypothetical protein